MLFKILQKILRQYRAQEICQIPRDLTHMTGWLYMLILIIYLQRQPKRTFPPRAQYTRPICVKLAVSRIRGAGLGIFASMHLYEGLVFGPYEGIVTDNETDEEPSGYAWRVGVH